MRFLSSSLSLVFIQSMVVSFLALIWIGQAAGSGDEDGPLRVGERSSLPDVYGKKTQAINKLEEKIRENRKKIQELIVQNISSNDSKKKQQIIAEMLKLHKLEKEMQDEYNDKVAELKYRYPEKADRSDRYYLPMRTQSLDEIKEELGLDADLSRLKQKVVLKYRPFTTTEQRQQDLVERRQRQLQKNKKKAEEQEVQTLRLVK